jgi:F0F1-type ATP synthase membrane subunit c/vacuolar-type H+-ATPase subunit K
MLARKVTSANPVAEAGAVDAFAAGLAGCFDCAATSIVQNGAASSAPTSAQRQPL